MGLEGTDISPKCEEGRKRMAEMLDLTGLVNHRDSAIGSLSGGQLQRALLGRALISRPEVLVLDEPLSYVDKRFEHRFYHIMQHIKSLPQLCWCRTKSQRLPQWPTATSALTAT